VPVPVAEREQANGEGRHEFDDSQKHGGGSELVEVVDEKPVSFPSATSYEPWPPSYRPARSPTAPPDPMPRLLPDWGFSFPGWRQQHAAATNSRPVDVAGSDPPPTGELRLRR
jgi:hypothetical protein